MRRDIGVVLVVGAGLMLATFFRLETLDPGFERQHILLVDVDACTRFKKHVHRGSPGMSLGQSGVDAPPG